MSRFSKTCLVPVVAAMPLAVARAEFKIGLALDRGGKDDKSFNASAFAVANEAKKKLGIFLK